MFAEFAARLYRERAMPLDEALEAAWRAFFDSLSDRRELTAYQVERTRQIFEAGWLARERVKD